MLEKERREAFHDGALAMFKAITVAFNHAQPWPLPSVIIDREFPKTCVKCGLQHSISPNKCNPYMNVPDICLDCGYSHGTGMACPKMAPKC